MSIFYHVSTNLYHTGSFEPRVPECRHQGAEDGNTPRISVAPTIEDCLTAMPNGGTRLEELNMERRGYYLIFKIDTDKLEISKENITDSTELFEKDLVRDAEITNECWITCPFTVPKEDAFLIRLISWNEESYDVFPHSIYEIADREYEGDYFEAYEDIYEELTPCTVGIESLVYISEHVKKGQELSLYFDNEDEKEYLGVFLNRNYRVDVTDISMDEMTIVFEKDSNLKALFLHHNRLIEL